MAEIIMLGSKKGVRTEHDGFAAMCAKWKRCRDVMSGQDAIHAGGIEYLPKLTEQTDPSYSAYKRRANFYNASWRTVAGLAGMMFRKPPKQETSDAIEDYLDNIDMQGVTFDQFAQDVATDVLEVGRIGLLVDYPPQLKAKDGTAPTKADVEAAGLRPTIQSYEAETIINWKFRNVKNATVLSMVVLKEEYEYPDGEGPPDDLTKKSTEFSAVCETRYRVLDLDAENFYRVRVFRINSKGDDVLVSETWPLMNGAKLDHITFVFIGPDGTEAELEEPPLIDLVDLNLAHYLANADYKHGLHFVALPTPYIFGYNPPAAKQGEAVAKLYIGAESILTFSDPTGTAGYMEVTGQGLTALKDYLEGCKQEMATLGARMLADSSARQVETFGATAIKHVAENSILAAIAISVSKGLKIALTWFQEWAGAGDQVKYDINRDFMPVEMDAPTLTALMAAWQGGALSEPEFFDLLKRGDLIAPEKTLEEHQGEIDAAPPPAPANPTAGRLGTMTPEEQTAHDAAAAKALADAVPPVKKVA